MSRCECIVKMPVEGSQYCIVQMDVDGFFPLLLQTIDLLWPQWVHCCPPMSVTCPSDVDGLLSPDLRGWLSVPYCEAVILSPQCIGLCLPCCLNCIHYSYAYVWVFCPKGGQASFSVLLGLSAQRCSICYLLKIVFSFPDTTITQGMPVLLN